MPDSQITVIASDARFKGEIHFEGTARILGVCEGSVSTPGTIEIAKGGRCNARVDAHRIMVDGHAEGELIGRERIELLPNAHVRADIAAGNLIVQDGASFVGHCSVGPDAVAKAGGSPGSQQHRRPAAESQAPRTEPQPEAIETRSVRPASQPAKVEAAAPAQHTPPRADLQSDWMRLAQGATDTQKRTG